MKWFKDVMDRLSTSSVDRVYWMTVTLQKPIHLIVKWPISVKLQPNLKIVKINNKDLNRNKIKEPKLAE